MGKYIKNQEHKPQSKHSIKTSQDCKAALWITKFTKYQQIKVSKVIPINYEMSWMVMEGHGRGWKVMEAREGREIFDLENHKNYKKSHGT